ncbi:hypothetical protein [Sphingomonas baiyangensis]|uniref:Uncharacterized protein n=1 Tax=Sphingomonas baiyangensis TaxID=2572576 RepID=A0A4U1L384_9SPHN|nr:hypothetical protein [Sphingomonas baiyangensis]TKD50690.1 hypothetical protein FBR43_07845 [Sphingomonas baiyangensis]
MIRATLVASAAAAGGLALWATAEPRNDALSAGFREDFDRGLCIAPCPGAHWAIAQQEDGDVAVRSAPDRAGRALHANTRARRPGRVAKADLVARFVPIAPGTIVTVAFDLRIPAGRPRNSLQLVDLECASCGEAGNPGIRLYLRHGRLRIDRAKIGERHAWVRDDAPQIAPDRWHRIVWRTRIGDKRMGETRVLLDGAEVLAARGATTAALPRRHVDRVQIGITASSNDVPAEAWFDNVDIALSR